MDCIAKDIESVDYKECLEGEFSGIEQIVTIWQHQDVATYPAYAATTGSQTPSAKAVTAAAAITMKATKFPIYLELMPESGHPTIKDDGNVFRTELLARVQNNSHNRGVVKDLKSTRFSFAFKEEGGELLLAGQSDGRTSNKLAKIKDGSINIDFGKAYNDEKYIEFTIECSPYQPVVYPFVIAYA